MLKGPVTHVVLPGEWLGAIAAQYGFGDPQKIWEHGNNAELRKLRSDPHLLIAGDKVFVPAPEPAELSCATGKRHRLVAKVPGLELKLELLGSDRKGLANQPYKISFGDDAIGQHVIEGVTSGSGALEAELPPSCMTAHLSLPDLGVDQVLHLGSLDPIDDEQTCTTGAQARLNNLGFMSGAVDGDHGDQTKEAVCTFQSKVMGHKQPSGKLDDATRARLRDEHGS